MEGHQSLVWTVHISPDGDSILTASEDRTARVWNGFDARLMTAFVGHGNNVFDAAFSPDGHRIVTASYDQTAKVWDTTTGGIVASLVGHSGATLGCAFSHNGRRIVTASQDRSARVWDASTGHLLGKLKATRRVSSRLHFHLMICTSLRRARITPREFGIRIPGPLRRRWKATAARFGRQCSSGWANTSLRQARTKVRPSGMRGRVEC